MENIEEHCDESLTESEVAPLVGKTAGLSNCPDVSSSNASILSSSSTDKTMAPPRFGNKISSSGRRLMSSQSVDLSGREEDAATSVMSIHKRMPHLHKLEKKHSSGDLHSRLKTRKLLGVGETDDGDIHRSKLSQILGHSDQLYIRLPYGLRLWQLLVAVMFTLTGLWALILPSHLLNTSDNGGEYISLPGRLYGGAVISLSIVYWMTLSSQDRDIIRMCMLSSMVYFVIQFVVSAFSSATLVSPIRAWLGAYVVVLWRIGQVLGSLYFYVMLTRDVKHYR
ncbi:hypothetical protein BsWGS_18791 [Bradybaena similaris]